jgi:putative transposase
VNPKAKRLFVIDGAKALRSAISKVLGSQHPVQRCGHHKIRDVVERLPEEQKDQVKARMRAWYKLEAKEGMARLRKLADWLEQEQPAAANSLREGLDECFTLNRLGIPPSMQRCLATTNLIESPQSVTHADASCVLLARPGHGGALGRGIVPGDGEELPPHLGLEGSRATGSDLRKKNGGNCCAPAGGRVT